MKKVNTTTKILGIATTIILITIVISMVIFVVIALDRAIETKTESEKVVQTFVIEAEITHMDVTYSDITYCRYFLAFSDGDIHGVIYNIDTQTYAMYREGDTIPIKVTETQDGFKYEIF